MQIETVGSVAFFAASIVICGIMTGQYLTRETFRNFCIGVRDDNMTFETFK